jgi:hypothetical protein
MIKFYYSTAPNPMKVALKTEMDDEAKRAMFPGNYLAQARS